MLASKDLQALKARIDGRASGDGFGIGRPAVTQQQVEPGRLYGGNRTSFLTSATPLDAFASPTAFTVIDRRASIIQSLQWRVGYDNPWTPQDEVTDVQAGHWMPSLLKRPNPDIVRSALFRLVSKWLDVNGNAYIYTPRYEGQSTPTEMWLLPSNKVQVVPGTDRLIDGYLYYGNGERYGIDADDVLHLKTLQPSGDAKYSVYVGQSLLLYATGAAMMEVEMQDYTTRYLKNDALPAFAVLAPQSLGEEQFQTFKHNWDETFKGGSAAGRWALLEGGMTLQTFAAPSQLKDLSNLSPAVMERICMVLGYPAAALTWQGLNRATAQEMRDDVLDVITKPHATYIAEEMTRHFSKYEYGLVIEPIFPAAQNAVAPVVAPTPPQQLARSANRGISDPPTTSEGD